MSASASRYDTQVLVVGAGPVGLTMAMALGKRGIRCRLIERSPKPGILPKMDLTNPRSMEIYGRLGLADKIREAGWPLDAKLDVHAGPSLADKPYLAIEYPSILEMQAQIAACTDGSMPREPYTRISQYNLEALLCREARALPGVAVDFGHELIGIEQDLDCVTARIRNAAGEEEVVTADYLVGCDGGNSAVRRILGIEYSGQAAVARNYMVFFRCPDLLEAAGLQAFRHYMIAGNRQATLVAQDDLKRWSLHVQIAHDTDESTLDPVEEVRAALGLDLEIEVLYAGAWTPHLLVANSFSRGRLFLAGDSVHQYIPTGGFGMNTGVAEADNLAWKIAAVLHGWGGPHLLDTYEEERRPVALRNCRAAEYAVLGVVSWRGLCHREILGKERPSAAAMRRLASAINTYQRRSHEQRGIELGYRYVESGACLHEFDALPDPDASVYQPSAAPGARLPHAWIEPGVSVHDRAGEDMTLLALDASESDVGAFVEAAASRAISLKVLRIDDRADLRTLYGARLLLLRPDLHVAWRGDAAMDPAAILAISTGYGEAPSAWAARIAARSETSSGVVAA